MVIINKEQSDKFDILKSAAEIIVTDFCNRDKDGLLQFLNQIVNACKSRSISHLKVLAYIYNDLALRIMGTQTPVEFFANEVHTRKELR